MASCTDSNPNLHSDAPSTSCEYVGGGDSGWTLEIIWEARRCNRRIDQPNQTPLHTFPHGLMATGADATLISILMPPTTRCGYVDEGGTLARFLKLGGKRASPTAAHCCCIKHTCTPSPWPDRIWY